MKPKKPRINIICSSSNYEESSKKYKKLRMNYLQSIHNNNLELIEEISSKIVIDNNSISITNKKQAYIKVFGTLIPITNKEASTLSNMTIIWE